MNDIENYKLINAELSKKVADLKKEVFRLRDKNKKVSVHLFYAQNEILRMKKHIADSHKIQVDHANVLTKELQSFVYKINEICVVSKEPSEVEQPSITNESGKKSNGSRRLSASYESPVRRLLPSNVNVKDYDSEEIGLMIITEEIEDEMDNTHNEMHSAITSICQSTIATVNSFKNSLLHSDIPTQSNDASVTNSHVNESNWMNSNKENETSESIKEPIECFGALSPFPNGAFVTIQRGKKGVTDRRISGVVSSTPNKRLSYKRNVNETNTDQTVVSIESTIETEAEVTNVADNRSNRIRNPNDTSNDSATSETKTSAIELVAPEESKNRGKIFSNLSNVSVTLEVETVPNELSSTRPKRKAAQGGSYIEPKLNTKLRRPPNVEPLHVRRKPKR